MARSDHFYQKDLQQHFGKLLPNAHPGASSKRDVLKPGGVSAGARHETFWLEVVLVREDLRHIVGVADTVDDVPAFRDLITLKQGWQNGDLTF